MATTPRYGDSTPRTSGFPLTRNLPETSKFEVVQQVKAAVHAHYEIWSLWRTRHGSRHRILLFYLDDYLLWCGGVASAFLDATSWLARPLVTVASSPRSPWRSPCRSPCRSS